MNALSSLLQSTPNMGVVTQTAFAKKGYKFFNSTAPYNVNIIGVRKASESPNLFDDSLMLIYNDATGPQLKVYDVTTHPGLYYLQNPIAGTGGTGILVANQYPKGFGLGTHTSHLLGGAIDSYACLTQITPVQVYRDNVKNGNLYYDPSTIQTGMFQVQIHRAMPNTVTTNVWNWSAACQVFSDPAQFSEFMSTVQKSASLYGDGFTYTLIGQNDLLT